MKMSLRRRRRWHPAANRPVHQRVDSVVNGRHDEGYAAEADAGGGPLASVERQSRVAFEQMQREGTHPVDGEAGDYDGRQRLPHQGVCGRGQKLSPVRCLVRAPCLR
ncbi:unnamed protein product [Ixodes pacificus]